MQKQQPTFHPISKASSFLEITGGMLKSAKEQLVNMENIQDQSHILDDELINRSVKLFGPVLRLRWFGTLGLIFVSFTSTEKHNVDTFVVFDKIKGCNN